MSAIDDRAPTAGIVLTGLFSVGFVFAIGRSYLLGLAAGVVLVASMYSQLRTLALVGGVGQLLGFITAGVTGTAPFGLLVGMVCLITAWDSYLYATEIGTTVGRAPSTSRLLGLHAAVTLALSSVVALVGYLVYGAIAGTYPIAIVLLLLGGPVVLLLLYRG